MAASDELETLDWQSMAECIRRTNNEVKTGDVSRVWGAIESLQPLPFPPGYLEWVRMEMLDILREKDTALADHACVYLAFFGAERASHMKVGIARDVKNRLASLRTGNPLPSLWTYYTSLPSRRVATQVEAALLRHMRTDRAQGEWVNVYGLSEQAAAEVVNSLSEVASTVRAAGPVAFRRLEV